MRSRPPRGCVLVVVGGLTVTLSIMLVTTWRKAALQDESAQWPTCDGIVIDSRVERRTATKGGTSHRSQIRYQYTVDGVTREGNRVSYNLKRSSPQAAREIVETYPVGSTVRVWYMPGDPTLAVLDASPADWVVTRLVGVAFMFVASGFALAIFWPWLEGRGLRARQARRHGSSRR